MKNNLYLKCFLFIGLMASCAKQQPTSKVNNITSEPQFDGNWKMVLYIDSTTGTTEDIAQSYLHPNVWTGSLPYPPAGDMKMKVVFNDSAKTHGTITASGIMNGCTLGFIVTPQKAFAKTSYIRTLAVDPPWGEYFFTYMPLASSYSFDGDSILRMMIPTKTLVFKRQ